MRLVGLALLAGWLVSWSAAPHGGPARSLSIVGAVACATSADRVAVAWVEVRRGAPHDTLHVAVFDERDRMVQKYEAPTGPDAIGFRFADAGDGSFVFVAEHREPGRHWFVAHRFERGRHVALRTAAGVLDGKSWQLAAAGDEAAIVEEAAGPVVYTHRLDPRGDWVTDEAPRTVVGAGGGHVVRYDEREPEGGASAAVLTVAPGRPAEWTAELARPGCLDGAQEGARTAEVVSVMGLRGGYARLVRRGADACVDGIRDGQPFFHRRVPLARFHAPRLALHEGRIAVVEDALIPSQPRVLLPEVPGGAMKVERGEIHPLLADTGVRYRVFGGFDRRGLVDVATRIHDGDLQVVLERQGIGSAKLLSPAPLYQPDYRPVLRRLAVIPLACLLAAVLLAARLLRRVRALAPIVGEEPLSAGRRTIAGTLLTDADAPRGGLRVRSGRSLLTLFLEGADVLRASDVRPRNQPRGDAIDVAKGAPVVATGMVEEGAVYRDEAKLRAVRGDLVIVGFSLAEARAQVARRVWSSLALLAGATLLVLAVIAR